MAHHKIKLSYAENILLLWEEMSFDIFCTFSNGQHQWSMEVNVLCVINSTTLVCAYLNASVLSPEYNWKLSIVCFFFRKQSCVHAQFDESFQFLPFLSSPVCLVTCLGSRYLNISVEMQHSAASALFLSHTSKDKTNNQIYWRIIVIYMDVPCSGKWMRWYWYIQVLLLFWQVCIGRSERGKQFSLAGLLRLTIASAF